MLLTDGSWFFEGFLDRSLLGRNYRELYLQSDLTHVFYMDELPKVHGVFVCKYGYIEDIRPEKYKFAGADVVNILFVFAGAGERFLHRFIHAKKVSALLSGCMLFFNELYAFSNIAIWYMLHHATIYIFFFQLMSFWIFSRTTLILMFDSVRWLRYQSNGIRKRVNMRSCSRLPSSSIVSGAGYHHCETHGWFNFIIHVVRWMFWSSSRTWIMLTCRFIRAYIYRTCIFCAPIFTVSLFTMSEFQRTSIKHTRISVHHYIPCLYLPYLNFQGTSINCTFIYRAPIFTVASFTMFPFTAKQYFTLNTGLMCKLFYFFRTFFLHFPENRHGKWSFDCAIWIWYAIVLQSN